MRDHDKEQQADNAKQAYAMYTEIDPAEQIPFRGIIATCFEEGNTSCNGSDKTDDDR